MQRIASFVRSTVVVAGIVVSAAGNVGAQQQQAAGGWQGWVGCWTAGPAIGGIAPSATSPLVCLAPTADANVVDVTTIAGGKVLSTQRIDASGREQVLASNGCTGTHRAQWSADGRRVYLKAVSTCAGVERVTSGIIAMSSAGEWLDVQGVVTRGDSGVRVARYRDAGVPSEVPEAIAAALKQRGWANQGARLALGGTIGTHAVLDATRSVTPAVVEAWLLERGQAFSLDARELVRLSDAGLPARVIDAMVVVSNPNVFAVARADESVRGGSASGARNAEDEIAGRRIFVTMDPMSSPYGWGYAPYGYGYGYGPYGYSPLGYGGYGYGSGRGYGYSGYPGYLAPIVVVNPQAQARGQAVKGRGYTQSEPSSATPTGSRREQGSSSSSGSSGSSSKPARSEPARSEPAQRTAKPRP